MGTVSGLSAARLQRARGRLVKFAAEMFEPMRRKDQRRWGEVYLRGLMFEAGASRSSRWRRGWRMVTSRGCSNSSTSRRGTRRPVRRRLRGG